MTVFNIKVYTDTICPWCYIGHKSLDKAIELYQKTYPGGSKDEFIFTFTPYYLDATAPEIGIPWAERVAAKNGEERVNAIRTRLQRVGRDVGIAFSFDSKIGKTRDSHRLLQHILKTKGNAAQKELLERIFYWHFEQDGDITSREGLIEVAGLAGLSKDEVRSFLGTNEGGEDVDRLAAEARASGVNSVPTIEINGRRILVEGAGDPHEFFGELVQAKSAVA